MSLSCVILAGLANSPKTGYELAKGFQGSIGFFWNATHQQIYRELERIHQQGWATVEIEPQPGKPDRKVYSLTETGREELRQWIESPADDGPSRNPLLVKLFVGHMGDRQKLITELKRHQAEHQKQLENYREIESQYFQKVDELPDNRRFQRYTLRHGIVYEEGWLTWCAEMLADLQT